MLAEWEQQDPGRTDRLFRSLQNVTPSHLADRELFDFESLATDASASAARDGRSATRSDARKPRHGAAPAGD